jgi:hypothetical protein
MTRRSERRPRRGAGVLRYDPRREREPLVPGSAATAPAPASVAYTNLQRVVIEQPQAWVIAVPDLDRGRLTALDRDLIGAARLLADAQRGAVLVAVAAGCLDDLGAAGADRVVRKPPELTCQRRWHARWPNWPVCIKPATCCSPTRRLQAVIWGAGSRRTWASDPRCA